MGTWEAQHCAAISTTDRLIIKSFFKYFETWMRTQARQIKRLAENRRGILNVAIKNALIAPSITTGMVWK